MATLKIKLDLVEALKIVLASRVGTLVVFCSNLSIKYLSLIPVYLQLKEHSYFSLLTTISFKNLSSVVGEV